MTWIMSETNSCGSQNSGSGRHEIDWNTTINTTFPILRFGRAYYFDYYTRETNDDLTGYITRLHEFLISKASRDLKNTGLDELLDIEPVEPSDALLSDFGEDDFIEQQILNELCVQYATRKQLILRAMYALVHSEQFTDDSLGVRLYGTNAFNLVWETACAAVFDSHLGVQLQHLPHIHLEEAFATDKSKALLEIIMKPEWRKGTNSPVYAKTLKPDLICVSRTENHSYFVIMDAKYYDIEFDVKSISGQPGIGDIDKQHLYQLAYNHFISEHKLLPMNLFLCPGEGEDVSVIGNVKMPIFDTSISEIITISLGAIKMLKCYVSGSKLDVVKTIPWLFVPNDATN